jgi:hypothetical protein
MADIEFAGQNRALQTGARLAQGQCQEHPRHRRHPRNAPGDPPKLLTMPVKNEIPVKLDMTWHE